MNKLLVSLSALCLTLLSCNDQNDLSQPTGTTSSTYGRGGGNNNTNPSALTLGGTKWQLTQYRDPSMTSPQPRTDTLVFSDATHFTWSRVASNYSLVSNNNSLALSLFGTPFGDIGGMPASNFQTYGQIIDVPFTQLNMNNGQTYYLWFKKLP